MGNKLELSLQKTNLLLDRAIAAHAKIALIGGPGVGKTTAARKAGERSGLPMSFLGGGNAEEWKRLLPYKTPDGQVETGLAYAARGGVLVIDEFTRGQSEDKNRFQTLAGANGRCLVSWPEGRTEEIELCIISTGNTEGVGVEEVSPAELDRYDFIVWVSPTDEEAVEILSQHHGQQAPRARVLWDAMKELASKLDAQKFHKPEGLRFAIALAEGLAMLDGIMSPAEVFRSTSERCFPLAKRGVERWRDEFDTLIAAEANEFERKLGTVSASAVGVIAPTAQPQFSINDLAQSVALPSLITAAVTLPFPITSPKTMVALQQGFGLGAVKALLKGIEKGQAQVIHHTVTVDTAGGKITFNGTARSAVQTFARAILKK